MNNDIFKNKNIGIISSNLHSHNTLSMTQIINLHGNVDFKYRKSIVESIHSVVWLKELQRILLDKYNIINDDYLYPQFCAGNVFIARKEIIEKAHGCVYENFFNSAYRADGEVGHGLERFYFYVSQCLNYKNLYI